MGDMIMKNEKDVFQNGSCWLKADFHLHTIADKEFICNVDKKIFIQKYIEQLKSTNTSVGVITNHNKFDKSEFVELKKAAAKEDIWLVPGIEFSLKEGIHLLIAFEDGWYKGHENNIAQFIDNAFYGVNTFDTPPYPNSRFSLDEVVGALDNIGHDYFLMLAHPDDSNGLFKVLSGRTLETFLQGDSFNKVVALQKSGNKSNYDRACELAGRALACVEGSDNAQKGVDSIGAGRTTFVKLGDFNFGALKYALVDSKSRISPKEKPDVCNSYIKSIAFEGGLLDGVKAGFSPELNNVIGIRGSGKSSILEILRYTLGIPLGAQSSDTDYKNGVIEHVMRSGGKVAVTVVDRMKKEYTIEKIYAQKEDVYANGQRIDVPSIDTVFKKPVYFGQKDLSNKHIDFEADLVQKLVGTKLDTVKAETVAKVSELKDVVAELKKLQDLAELKKETNDVIAGAEYKLKVFKEKGIEDKLKRQSLFDSDISRYNAILSEVVRFESELGSLYANYSSFFVEPKFISDQNKDLFDQAEAVFKRITENFTKLNKVKCNVGSDVDKLKKIQGKLLDKKESLKNEFAEIKREIDISNLNPDDFLKLNRIIEISKLKLIEIEKSENRKADLNKLLNDKVSELNQLWHKEFQVLEKEVARINEYENSLSISVDYKGRKDKFLDKLKDLLRGSGLRSSTYEKVQSTYKDFIEIYRELDNLNNNLNISESLIGEFKQRFDSNLADLLAFRVDDKFTINYNGKPLGDHSLGQRATALILFLLAQKETDVLIIDQPEDDLDNQTIYEDVIKQVKALKGEMQFIFATHNANIPVLGDSEKIISCKYVESEIETTAGTIDSHEMQKQIVTIMEGGKDAFNLRKNIYSIWNVERR